MIFSQEQKDFLKNLISFEIIDLQNQFVSYSETLKNLISDFKNSIKFDEIFFERIQDDFFYEFSTCLNFSQNQINENINDDLNKSKIYSQRNIEILKFLNEDNFNMRIANLRMSSIKNFLKTNIDEKKKIKKILETGLFLDLYDFLVRRFDPFYNSNLITKIAGKFNDKFSLELFLPWILNEKSFLKNFHPKNNEYQNLSYKEQKFSERFINEIAFFCELELFSKQKNYIKFFKMNNLQFDQKNHKNINNFLKSLLENAYDIFIFFEKKNIDLIQNNIDNFYMNEIANYYENKITS
jgi:hypothetical protein